MSTHINDLRSATVVAALDPTDLTASHNGSAVNLAAGDGPCFAIQHVGDAPGDGTLAGRIEQSDDGTTWTAISGAAFTQVAGGDVVQVIRFHRSAKYIRWVGTLAGSSPEFIVGVLVGELKKTF